MLYKYHKWYACVYVHNESAVDGSKFDGSKVDGSKVDGSKTDGSKTDGSSRIRTNRRSRHRLRQVETVLALRNRRQSVALYRASFSTRNLHLRIDVFVRLVPHSMVNAEL